MLGYDASTYGERWADVYDDWYDDPEEVAAVTAFLRDLAGPPGAAGPLLELGIGTGLLALPLADAGYDVRGIDASPAMLDRLRAKPGSERIAVAADDMARVALPVRPTDGPTPPPVTGVYVAANTFFGLPDEATQRRCLHGIARTLAPDGFFAVAAFIPDLHAPPPARGTVGIRSMTADQVVLTADRHDPEAQTISGQFIDISGAGVQLRPFHIRYTLPHQLDAMATDAGLVLDQRWAGWRHEPFDADSAMHVSVYRRAAAR